MHSDQRYGALSSLHASGGLTLGYGPRIRTSAVVRKLTTAV
jgi:hypothetical protein